MCLGINIKSLSCVHWWYISFCCCVELPCMDILQFLYSKSKLFDVANAQNLGGDGLRNGECISKCIRKKKKKKKWDGNHGICLPRSLKFIPRARGSHYGVLKGWKGICNQTAVPSLPLSLQSVITYSSPQDESLRLPSRVDTLPPLSLIFILS